MERLSFLSPSDLQASLANAVRERRRARGLSRRALALQSGVPQATIKRFETTGQISLRQFLLLWQCVDRLERLAALCEPETPAPRTIEDVLDEGANTS